MARLPDPTGSLSPAAHALYDELVGQRGRIDGMYRSLLNHPELARRVSDLGTFLRFGAGALPAAVRELVILWLARQVGAAYEWVKHEPLARAAGLSDTVIARAPGREGAPRPGRNPAGSPGGGPMRVGIPIHPPRPPGERSSAWWGSRASSNWWCW